MPTLSFAVQADYEKVVKFKNEIARLEAELTRLDGNAAPDTIQRLEQQLASAKQGLMLLTTEAAKTGAAFEKAALTVSGLGKDFDVSTPEERIQALNTVIRDNQQAITEAQVNLRNYQAQATEAFNSGDMGAFKATAADIQSESERLQQLTDETNNYIAALQVVQESAGLAFTPPTESVQYFDTQESYEQAQNLRQEVQNLQEQIATFKGDPQGLLELNSELIEAQDELREVEGAAADAASRLGEDLGGRAAETSSRLYELNNAVEEQEAVVADLSAQLESAAAHMQALESSGDPVQIQDAQIQYQTLAEQVNNAENALRNLKAAQQDAESSWSQTSQQIREHDSVLVKLLGGQEKYNEVMANMPPMVQNGARAITGMTGAARAFIATPLGAVIAAIVLGIKALTTWFNSSREGQMAFAQASGYVTGILNQLNEIVIGVGKALYNAFTNPQQAVKDLWQTIKTNVVNRFKGLGGVFKSTGDLLMAVFNVDPDGMKKAFADLQENATKAATGVENLGKKVKDYVKGVNDAAKANADLNVRERKLRQQRGEWQVQEAELDRKISDARMKMYSGTDKERLAATKQAQELINQKYAKQLEFAREEYNIIKKRNSLTTNAQEDYEAEQEARAKIIRLQAQQNNEKAMFARRGASMENRLNRQGASAGNSAADAAKAEADAAAQRAQAIKQYGRQIVQEIEATELEIREKQLELQEESFDKELDLITLAYDKEIAAVNKKEDEMIEALANKKVVEWKNAHPKESQKAEIEYRESLLDPESKTKLTRKDLTDDQKTQLEEQERIANEVRLKATADLYKSLTEEFANYTQRKEKINEDYDKKRKALEQAPISTEEREAAIKVLEEKRKESIKAVDAEEAKSLKKNSAFMVRIFADASKKTSQQIRQTIKDGEALLAYLQKEPSEMTEEGAGVFGMTLEQLEALKNSPEDIKAITEQIEKLQDVARKANPFKALADSLKDLFDKKSKNNTEAKIKNLGKSTKDVADVVADAGQKLATMFAAAGSTSMQEGAETMAQIAGYASQIGAGAASGGWVGAAIAAAGVATDMITKAFSAESRHEEAQRQVMAELTNQTEALRLSLLDTALAAKGLTTMFGEDKWGKAANAVDVARKSVNALKHALATSGNNSSKLSDDLWGTPGAVLRSQRYTEQGLAGLANIGVKTGHEKTGLFGLGAGRDTFSSLLEVYPNLVSESGEFNKELAKSILSTRELAENGKEQLQNMIDIYEEQEKALDSLKSYFTDVFGQLGQNISDALVNAFKNGTDASRAFTKSVTSMLERLAQDMIYSVTLAPMIKQAQDKMMQISKQDGMSQEEKFRNYTKVLSELTDDATTQQKTFNDLMDYYQQLASAKGYDLWKDKSEQEASKAVSSTITEDQAEAINGRMTAINESQLRSEEMNQERNTSILEVSGKISDLTQVGVDIYDVTDEIRDIVAKSYLELQRIGDNTEAVVKPIKQMQTDIAYMKSNGIKSL